MEWLGETPLVRPNSPARQHLACDYDTIQYKILEISASDQEQEHHGIDQDELPCGIAVTAFKVKEENSKEKINLQVYWCNFCSYKTNSSEELMNHVADHSFVCEHCLYRSFSRSDIIRHSISVHAVFKETANSYRYCFLKPSFEIDCAGEISNLLEDDQKNKKNATDYDSFLTSLIDQAFDQCKEETDSSKIEQAGQSNSDEKYIQKIGLQSGSSGNDFLYDNDNDVSEFSNVTSFEKEKEPSNQWKSKRLTRKRKSKHWTNELLGIQETRQILAKKILARKKLKSDQSDGLMNVQEKSAELMDIDNVSVSQIMDKPNTYGQGNASQLKHTRDTSISIKTECDMTDVNTFDFSAVTVKKEPMEYEADVKRNSSEWQKNHETTTSSSPDKETSKPTIHVVKHQLSHEQTEDVKCEIEATDTPESGSDPVCESDIPDIPDCTLVCGHCNRIASNPANLKVHINMVHSGDMKYMAFRQVPGESPNRHGSVSIQGQNDWTLSCNLENDKDFVCLHCTYTSQNRTLIKVHVLTTHGKGEAGYTIIKDGDLDTLVRFCRCCLYETTNLDDLVNHLILAHNNLLEPEGVSTPSISSEISSNLESSLDIFCDEKKKTNFIPMYECVYCNDNGQVTYVTSKSANMKSHILTLHNEKEKTFKQRGAKERNIRGWVYFCEHCLWETRDKAKLNHHFLQKHPQEQDVKPGAPKSTKKTYADVAKYGCIMCEFISTRRYGIKNHITKSHASVCETAFIVLSAHVPIADCLKLYFCGQCLWECKTEEELEFHQNEKHGSGNNDFVDENEETGAVAESPVPVLLFKAKPGINN